MCSNIGDIGAFVDVVAGCPATVPHASPTCHEPDPAADATSRPTLSPPCPGLLRGAAQTLYLGIAGAPEEGVTIRSRTAVGQECVTVHYQ